MAYCDKCGAYIPDGQSKCLACGFDGAEEERRAAQAARQQEDQRAQAEQRRRERQELNKKWAESEQQHRRNIEELERRRKEAEEKARREAEEKARREAEQKKADGWQQTEYGSFRFTDGDKRSGAAQGHNKLLAALSYVNILFLIPLLFTQNDEFAKFHARQGARLFVCNAIGSILGSIFSIGWVINLLLIYLMIVGIKNALEDKWEPLPYIGKFKLF